MIISILAKRLCVRSTVPRSACSSILLVLRKESRSRPTEDSSSKESAKDTGLNCKTTLEHVKNKRDMISYIRVSNKSPLLLNLIQNSWKSQSMHAQRRKHEE